MSNAKEHLVQDAIDKKGTPMPLFSVIIPAYNNAEYLGKCLQSLQNQTFHDWEALIVVDGSPDNAADIATSVASQDQRFIPLIKKNNEGTHLARKTGVKHASGNYALFLDADDELKKNALQELKIAIQASAPDIDVIHFGMELFGIDMPKDVCNGMLEQSNAQLPDAHNEEIIQSTFAERKQDWRVLQRLYSSDLLKNAFANMTDSRLGRGQDAYEWLVISSSAKHETFRNDLILYRYYLGRGITNVQPISGEKWLKNAKAFNDGIQAGYQYANSFKSFDMKIYVDDLKNHQLELLMNDWHIRVNNAEKISVALKSAELFGEDAIAAELMRLARDDAYYLWDHQLPFSEHEPFIQWIRCAQQLVNNENPSERYRSFSEATLNHLNDLRNREKQSPHINTLLQKVKQFFIR